MAVCDSLRPDDALAGAGAAAIDFFDCESLRPVALAGAGAAAAFFSATERALAGAGAAAAFLEGTSAGPATSRAFLEDCWLSSRAWAAAERVFFFLKEEREEEN